MKRITIDVPDVAHVCIVGPVQCGKTTLLARIEQVLREEFGATTTSVVLEKEKRLGDPYQPKSWEIDMVRNTVWVLGESVDG